MYGLRREDNIKRCPEGCEVVDWNLMADDGLALILLTWRIW